MAAARGVFAIAILVLAGVTWNEFNTPPPEPAAPLGVQYLDSVAVLPIRNLTGDTAHDHIGVGVADEVIMRLSRIPPLKVISRHSAQAASRQNLTIQQLGNALNVRQIIEGTIQLRDNELTVTVQQVNAENGNSVWSHVIRESIDNMRDLQESIARHVTNSFVETMPGQTVPVFDDQVEPGPGQVAYLAGKRRLGERTAESMKLALQDFQTAIELDPGYAPAYADLSSAYALSVFYRYDVGAESYTLAAQSLAFAEHAIALDDSLAAGFAARGYLGALIGQAGEAVEADFDRAAALQPNAASIPSWRARSLAQMGHYEEAFSEASRAIDLDPLAPGRHIALAELSLQLGRYDQAIASAKMATALEPRIIRSRTIEARALLLNGNPQRCANLPLGPHQVLRATCLKVSGRAMEADAIVDKTLDDIREKRLQVNGTTEVAVFEDLAVYYAFRGDAENALFWSAKAYTASPVGLEIRVLESALFDKVRDDPNFATSIAAIRADLYDRVKRDSAQFR